MSYKPELSDVVRKLLNSTLFYRTHLELDTYEIDGKELEDQLRNALYESDLKAMQEEGL